MKHRIFERLIEELVEQVKDCAKEERIGFAKWAVEQGIQARDTSKTSEDQEMFLASESLFAAGLYALLSDRVDKAIKSKQ